ncbi:MAG: 1-deoxy-D-xylulose-5-phosphate reductoisomerase [Alphaproteobacteria bacterium]|nr:1-deoxy-D-xylulose-5-phosphate reductoisomerase [Alphaproteobacteria bacterium]
MPSRTINILGATGSVGQCAADVVAKNPDRFSVQTVTAHGNTRKLAETAIRLKARKAVLCDRKEEAILRELLKGTEIEIGIGPDSLLESSCSAVDVTLAAIAGLAGLDSVLNALRHSRVVAIANKEPLVAAGPLVMQTARQSGCTLLPVDSEHNAIFQVLDTKNLQSVENLILTASGGPFLNREISELEHVTPAQAVAHPNWSMGAKISVDSATMMNKALEIIEAHYLFDMPGEKIKVLIHPQSVVHSMVEYTDGSVLAQMGASDMRTPLSHALAWPERLPTPGQKLTLNTMKHLTFSEPDPVRFPALKLAYVCLENGPEACIALNAANEAAVEAFLAEKISFYDIVGTVEYIVTQALGSETPMASNSLDDIKKIDGRIRALTQDYISKNPRRRTVAG